jgi:hypothetical protein
MPPLAVVLSLSLVLGAEPTSMAAGGPAQAAPAPDLPTLRLAGLVENGPAGLGASSRARALAGRRVRLLGYMVRMEEPEPGGFWLAPHPVNCDEGGGGTGDLPPDAVRVVFRSPRDPLGHVDGPLAVTGVLQVGNEADASGRVSAFRILLDEPGSAGSSRPAVSQKP